MQISQPRAPCWKLGRRWNRLDMPKLVVQSGRTGWYLRVLETGDVECGDALTLVDRPFPRWTIDAVNAVAYSRGGTVDLDAARELANCPALAESWRGGFRDLSNRHLDSATRRRSHREIRAFAFPAKARWPAAGVRFAKGSNFMRTSCRH